MNLEKQKKKTILIANIKLLLFVLVVEYNKKKIGNIFFWSDLKDNSQANPCHCCCRRRACQNFYFFFLNIYLEISITNTKSGDEQKYISRAF